MSAATSSGPRGRRARILSVVGTRPEAIKMAPVIAAAEAEPLLTHRLVLTGQHAGMARQILDQFGIKADADLKIMRPGQDLYDIGKACLSGLPDLFRKYSPDATLVQGDTATVFFAALAAFFEKCPLGHVEAGLRSRRKWSPFPEEMLRRTTDALSDYHFAPTPEAGENLRREGVPESSIFVTGNTVVDALRRIRGQAPGISNPHLARWVREQRPFVLLTTHRRESLGAPMEGVLRAVAEFPRLFGVKVLFPAHPNPKVQEPARAILGKVRGVRVTEPLPYEDLLAALEHARIALTDSGGIQEEAPAFSTHTLVLREVTERPEAVQAGAATLVGTDPDRITRAARARLEGDEGSALPSNPYGDGRAGERIVDILVARLCGRARRTRDWRGP